MKPAPLISAVMANDNCARYVGEAIGSVVKQTRDDWELVVIDNQSGDDSWRIIQNWATKDHRIRAVAAACKQSVPEAVNMGIQQTQGKYVGRIDSDDVWQPVRLERQIEFMERPGSERIGVCGTQCLLIDKEGQVIGRKDFPQSDAACRRALWFRNPFCQSATLIRRECFAAHGLYNHAFPLAEDLELWFRFGQQFRFHNLPEYLTQYRITGDNVTFRRHQSMVASTLRARREAIRKYGYSMTAAGRLALALTWTAQWLPASWARAIFYNVFLRHCAGGSGNSGEPATRQQSANPASHAVHHATKGGQSQENQ